MVVTAAPHLIGTQRRSLRDIMMTPGHPGLRDHIPSELEMVPGSGSFILLSLARLLSLIQG